MRFDDEPTLTSAKVTGTNTVTLEFSEELVGGPTDAFAVSTNGVSNTRWRWLHGERINGDADVLGTAAQPGDETQQVSYLRSACRSAEGC